MKCLKVLRHQLDENMFYYSRQTAVALTEFASLYYKKLLHKEAVKGL